MKKSLIALLVLSGSVDASTYYINIAENLKEYYIVDTNKVWNASSSTFTEWMNVDSPFDLSLYLPQISNQREDFSQTQTFRQKQNQFEQKKVYEESLNIYQDIGNPIEHLQTISDSNTREVVVISEDWELINGIINCEEWSPLDSTILFNEEFTQSRQCEQERSTNIAYYINDNLETILPFSEISLVVEDQKSFGTNADTGWLLSDSSFSEWLDFEAGYDYLAWSPDISQQLVDFVQNRDYSQDQTQIEQPREQNTFTLEYRDFGESTELNQTTINNEERNIVVELGEWVDEGTYYDCLDFSPLIDTVEYGIEFTQNANCQQEQVATLTFKFEEDILVTDTTSQIIINNIELLNTGTNSEGGWITTTSLLGSWVDSGLAYDETVWTPTLSNQTINLTQSQNNSQDQTQTEQTREQNTFTSEIRNVGEESINTQTITNTQNRAITVTSQNWENVGILKDCDNWTPNKVTITNGLSFSQSRNCTQTQSMTYNQKHNTDILNTFTLNQDILVLENQNVTGTKPLTSCLNILNEGLSTGSGNYNITINGTTRNVYCDMTTSGGGWTLVFYSNSNIVNRDMLASGDWNAGSNINFSYLHSFKDVKNNGKYEFFIHDSSTIFRNVIFNQTNSYLQNPNGNNFTQTGGNFYYSSQASGWRGLSLGSYGNSAMQVNCSLAMSFEGGSWTYCLQDQATSYNTAPWFYDSSLGGYDEGSQAWVKVYQR